jgi:Flp pilus assembly protein TadG
VNRVRFHEERGSVTIVAAAILVVIAAMALGATDVWRVVAAKSRAQTAADAAALAAVQELALPVSGADPAAQAALFAAHNGAQLETCDCSLGQQAAVVEASIPVGRLVVLPDDLEARATARAVVGVDPSGVGS